MNKKTPYISLIALFEVSFFYGVGIGYYAGLELQGLLGLVAIVGFLVWLIRRENTQNDQKDSRTPQMRGKPLDQKSRMPDKNAYVVD